MYKVYRKYKKNGFQNTLKMAKCARFEALWGGGDAVENAASFD